MKRAKLPLSAKEFKGMHYEDTVKLLLETGFA